MRQKLGLATSLGARPAVFLGLLALTLLSAAGWTGIAQAQVYGNVSYVTTGTAPRSPTLGDLNGDGIPDLLVANSGDNTVSIFLGGANYTFNPSSTPTVATGTGPRSIALGNLNGGGMDFVVVNNGTPSVPGNTVSVFLGNGDGTFITPATTYATGTSPFNAVLADVNNDGKLDLLVTNNGDNTVSVFLGNGNGTFATPATIISTDAKPAGIRLGDLNTDGKLDLLVAYNGNTSSTISVFLGDGSGSFTPASQPTITTGTKPSAPRIADLNNDGYLDLVVANELSNNVSVFLGNGNGTFQARTDYAAGSGAGPTSLVLADMNADGDLDLVVVNKNDTGSAGASIFLGNGDGTFRTKVDYATAAGPTGVAVGDLNGDGMLDLAVAGTGGNSVSIFENTTTVLAVFPNGSGMGTVTSDLGGINCPTSCRAYFTSNISPTVTLTATASAGSTFIGWSGRGTDTVACSGTGTCTVSMNKSRAISAMFQKDGSSGFVPADLAGTWHFTYFKDSVTGNDPGWTFLVITLDASGAVTSGSFIDSTGNAGPLAAGDGAFIIDGAGLISGWAGPAGGRVTFPYGKLSPSKTIMGAISVKGPNGRGMVVGTKGGGSFTASDLAGTWHSSYFSDYLPTNDPSWADVTMVIDASGTVTSGSYTPSHGTAGTLNGGSFPINGNGVITSGSVTSPEGGGPTFPKGKLDASKTMLAAVANEAPNGRGAIISIKGGGSYSTADLAGTWYFVNYLDRFPTNGPQWAVATITLDTGGVLTSGSFVSSLGNYGNHDSGLFTIKPDGTGSGSVSVGGGGKLFPHLKMDPSKTVILSVISESPNGIGISMGIKGGSIFRPTLNVAKAGTGTGTVTSGLAGIDCGTTCLAAFTAGDDISLTAVPDSGSTFAGWSGDDYCTGPVPCMLPMDQSRSVTATFNSIANHILTVSVGGSSPGSLTSAPSGINNCTGLGCNASFTSGVTVTLTASADPGGVFREWRGDACNLSTSPICPVQMNGPMTVQAVFSKSLADPSLAAGTGVKAAHFTELRSAVDWLRNRNGLNPFTWTDGTLSVGSTVVKRQHLLDLRNALEEAYTRAGKTHNAYTDPEITAGTTPIKASHLTQLRTYVRDLE